MGNKLMKWVLGVCLAAILASCGEYNRLLKSTDYEKKYNAAVSYYEKKEYTKALALLEELASVYRGTNKAEKIMYYYAYSTYAVGDYLLAGYHFNNFVRTFPASDKVEECAFMYAYCYYLESPRYSLDQTDTRNAIKELQFFLNKYPESSKKEQCNTLIASLREKLEKKYYEIAMQYYFLDDYKAAIVAFENLLKDYPDTKYREEVMFMILKANYVYATRSIESKKLDRLKSTIEAYNKFVSYYQNSQYQKDAEDIYKNSIKLKEQLAYSIPYLYYEMGQYDNAIDGLKNAIASYPENPQREKANFIILNAVYNKATMSNGYTKEKNVLEAIFSWQNFYSNITLEAYKKTADKHYTSLIAKKENLVRSIPEWFYANKKYRDAVSGAEKSLSRNLSSFDREALSIILIDSYYQLALEGWDSN